MLLVGEAWGADEAAAQRPFVGASGHELNKMLAEAGIPRESVLCTNLVHAHPPSNDFTHFLIPSKERPLDFLGIHPSPALRAGIESLYTLIEAVRPRLIIAAGNWPLLALSDVPKISTSSGFRVPSGITSWRGSQLYSREIGGRRFPLLPIIHPAAVLREWAFRSTTVHDLRARGRLFLDGKGSWDPPAHHFISKPTKADLEAFFASTRELLRKEGDGLYLSVDLETYKRKWISVVGLADADVALCIPFFFADGEQLVNYWSLEDEQWIWEQLKYILHHPQTRIIGQNFIYDTEWFHRYYNISAHVQFDTMVAHHLLFPGTPKSLDVLASLYCNHYIYWKDESGDWDRFPEDANRYWLYNCKDTRATYECAHVLKHVLKHQGMEELYSFQLAQWNLSRQMTLRGSAFDSSLQQAMRSELSVAVSKLESWLLEAVPEFARYTSTKKPWFDSPKGTMGLLYGKLGFDPILHKKTKKPSSDANALEELRQTKSAAWLKPLFDRLDAHRSAKVFISHFLDARPRPDGRMPFSFNVAHPETFRWSSNANGFGEGLNGQNLPKGDD